MAQNPDNDPKVRQELTINGKVFILEGTVNFKITPKEGAPPVIDPEVPPTPKPEPEPGKPEKPTDFGTIKEGKKWTTNAGPASTWLLSNMDNPKDQFKFISSNDQKNIIANIKSEAQAKAIQNYFAANPTEFPPKTSPATPPEVEGPTPKPPEEPVPGDKGDLFEHMGVKLPYKEKVGGQQITQTKYKFSTHNTGDRDTFYSDFEWTCVNKVSFIYANANLSDNSEELTFKEDGGSHNDDNPREGRCYCAGIEINGGPSFKKEYPEHNTTPDFSNKVNFADPNFKNVGSIEDKKIGLMVARYNFGNSVVIETFLDLDGSGNWKPWWWIQDKGQYAGEPYLVNQAQVNNGKGKFYMRIDTPTRKTVLDLLGGVEIEPVTTPVFAKAEKV